MHAKPCTSASATDAASAGGEAKPRRAGHRGDRRGREGRAEHLALEPDVDDPRALGEEPAERGEHQRRGAAQRGGYKERAEEDGLAHTRCTSAATGRRSACSSAPHTRMISPWITTTMSRLSFGMSKVSSEPPW